VVIALEKLNQVFDAAGVRLCHAPDSQVRCLAERPTTCLIADNI